MIYPLAWRACPGLGIAARLDAWLTKRAGYAGRAVLQAMVPSAVKKFGFDSDKFVMSWSIRSSAITTGAGSDARAQRAGRTRDLMWAMCGTRGRRVLSSSTRSRAARQPCANSGH